MANPLRKPPAHRTPRPPLLVLEGDDSRAKPFLKWAGGKTQLLPDLMKFAPRQFNRYFEPMVGSGAVFFSLRPDKATLIDTNPELINCYTVIQHRVEALIKELKTHRYEEEYFYKVRDIDRTDEYLDWSSVKRAARMIFLNKTCFNGLFRVNASGHFNVPFGRYSNPRIFDPKNLEACARALQNVTLHTAGFEIVLKQAKAGDFVYFDPPYIPLSKTSNFTSYSRDGFSMEDQERLRDVALKLKKRGAHVVLSNSHTPEIFELYKDFKIHTVEATRAINANSDKRGKVKEVIIVG